jgi:hypothetical protein
VGWLAARQATQIHLSFAEVSQLIFGMCRSQHDIQVEQQRSRRANKQMRDTMKLMHNAKGFNHLALHHLQSLHRLRYVPLRKG